VFIGHFGVGFAAKRLAPRTSLTTLIAAAIFIDVLWPLSVWLGLQQAHSHSGGTAIIPFDLSPYFHSLFMALVWSAVLALAYRARTHYAAGAVVVGLAASSHWLLDFISHDQNLSLMPGLAIRVGLGFGAETITSAAIEGTLFVVGLALYLRTTRAKGWVGHVSLWSIVGLLALAFLGALVGPLPSIAETLRSVPIAMLALVLWLILVDRTRALQTAPKALTDA
jgi:hypothetical protein